MIRYELKDEERRAELEKALPGFAKALQNHCEAQFNDQTSFVNVAIRVDKGGVNECIVSIQKDAILAKKTYDPSHWNNYPELTPPEKVWMQCEGHFTTGGKYKGGAVYDGEHWYVPILGTLARYNIVIERFRPWDEEVTK